MSKLKKMTQHLRNMGPLEFAQSGFEWSKKRIYQKIDRRLRVQGFPLPVPRISNPDWIAMTFGLANAAGADFPAETFTSEEIERILSEAERSCQRKFSLLGSSEQDFSEVIDWHTDFKSGYEWPLNYYLDISKAIGDAEYTRRHADIKVPWELSRMQHLIPLGQAFCLSGNRRYYEEFKFQTMDWISRNPYKLGPNWACTMDVAIRAVNWTAAAVYFKGAIDSDPLFSEALLNHLMQTGEFIEENLECDLYGHGNNHYLANLTGLVFLGLLLKKALPKAGKWLKRGMAGLESEMRHQVNADGGSFEGSLSYHRLSAEMFLFTAVTLRQNGLEFSEATLGRLEKMCGFIQDYSKPNGKAPVIGDADDGRLLTLGTYWNEDKRDHRHLLGTAGIFFNRPDFIASAGPELAEMKWLYGPSSPQSYPDELPAYAAYPETGFYIYRDKGLYLIIKCGPVGSRGKGGHDHNDQLSFELNIQGADVVVDPGTFVYTADKEQRQAFRSIAAHNVVQYAHFEQNTIRNDWLAQLFRMESAQGGQCVEAGLTPEGFCFEGTMGYEDSGVSLRRRITVNRAERTLELRDTFEGSHSGEGHVERLHLSKDVTDITLSGNTALLKTLGDASIPLTASAPVRPRPCRISESYGVFYEAVCLEWPLDRESTCTISY